MRKRYRAVPHRCGTDDADSTQPGLVFTAAANTIRNAINSGRKVQHRDMRNGTTTQRKRIARKNMYKRRPIRARTKEARNKPEAKRSCAIWPARVVAHSSAVFEEKKWVLFRVRRSRRKADGPL